MAKRVNKLTFLVSLNINQELAIIKVKREGQSEWYAFDEDLQDIEMHPLICKRVRAIKLKKVDNTKELEHYFTDSEFKNYVTSDKFVFNQKTLQVASGQPSAKRLKGGLLDYRNLGFIDFFKKFDKESVGLSSREKFSKLEELVDDSSLSNSIKIAKFSAEWSAFHDKFENLVSKKFVQFITDGESKSFTMPSSFTSFATEYFDFCRVAYPKASFKDNLTKFISKLPSGYALFVLRIKCDSVNEFFENLPMLNALIQSDYEQQEAAKKAAFKPSESSNLTAGSANLTQRSRAPTILSSSSIDFSPQDVSNVSTHVKSAISDVVNYFIPDLSGRSNQSDDGN